MSIDEFFREQHGLVSRQQARALNLSLDQIRYRLAGQAWIEVQPGVYRHGAVAESWESALLAATMSTGGVASHRCAAALWGLELYKTAPIEVSIPSGGRTRRSDVRIHRTTQWELIDAQTRRGIPCTGIERTILDCGGVVGPVTVERLAESAIRQRLTTWPELARCLSRHSRRGRNGCLNLRTVLEERLANATVPLSDFSRVVANLLVDNGLPAPVLEFPIHDEAGRFIMQTDLAWPHLMKSWELDGLEFHFARESVERDRRKRNEAKAIGWNIQEILWSMYANEPDQLVALARTSLL